MFRIKLKGTDCEIRELTLKKFLEIKKKFKAKKVVIKNDLKTSNF